MSTTEISMEVVEKYLEYFFEEERRSTDCYGEVLRLPIFKTVLYEFCQNPDAEMDEEVIEAEIAKNKYVYTTSGKVISLAMRKAKEICGAEALELTNFELFKAQKAVEHMRMDFSKLEKKLQRIEKKLK